MFFYDRSSLTVYFSRSLFTIVGPSESNGPIFTFVGRLLSDRWPIEFDDIIPSLDRWPLRIQPSFRCLIEANHRCFRSIVVRSVLKVPFDDRWPIIFNYLSVFTIDRSPIIFNDLSICFFDRWAMDFHNHLVLRSLANN